MKTSVNTKIFNLTLSDTNFLKGVAIVLMLLHHLFYVRQELYDDVLLIGHYNLVNEIGQFGKVCVAIFVFLSGYGLQKVDSTRHESLKQYYVHRYVKLYMNYWLIWLLFVPLSVFCFGRTFQDAYGGMVFSKLFLDFWGVLNVFGQYGYNPTWWFYSTIIILYFVYPYIKRWSRHPVILILLGIGSYYLYMVNSVFLYLLPFVLGIVFAEYCYKINIPAFTPPISKMINSILCLLVLGIVFLERIKACDKILYDSFIVLILIMEYRLLYIPKIIKDIFSFLGKHSMNIFLFHTFIFLYWFKDFIYYTRNPIIIFVSLLIPCLIISIAIEKLKAVIGFNKMNMYIEKLLCQRIKK